MCSRLDTSKSRLTPWDRSKSQHNEPTVIKHCQNVRLTSAKLLVKFQLDCCKIKANTPWECIHGFGSTRLAVFCDGQKTPSTYGSSFPPNDQRVINLRQNLRLASAKRYVKFQLDSDKITENFTIPCVHVSTPQSPYLLPGTVLNPDIMIRQSSNIVRMCASPARNCL